MIWAEIIGGLTTFGIANYGLYKLGMWTARNDLRKTIIELEKEKSLNSGILKECQEHLKYMEEINSKGLAWLGRQGEGGLDAQLLQDCGQCWDCSQNPNCPAFKEDCLKIAKIKQEK